MFGLKFCDSEFEGTSLKLKFLLGNFVGRFFAIAILEGPSDILVLLIYRRRSASMSWSVTDDVFPSASLASYLDRKLLVLTRDGRKLVGNFCSYDQYANIVLQGASERVTVGDLYSDIPLGLYIIRGENVILMGELDLDKEELPPRMIQVSAPEIERAQRAEREAAELKGTMRKRMEFLDFD